MPEEINETNEKVETTEQTTEEGQENTTYTQSEVDSKISKAVESAIANREKKNEKEIADRIEKERNEAAEYAKLTQKEQEETDYKKRVEEIEQREKELNNRELLGQVESDLKENNLPLSFAETLLSVQDNEKIKGKIAGIKKDFDEAVNAQVKEALRQDTPSASTRDSNNAKLDEMTLTERIAYKKDNPEAYDKLVGK